ncbi:TPA: hypothetical protein G8Z02_004582 [Salmonella enterica]|nr:hypothetical protein [Salmonella enterica]
MMAESPFIEEVRHRTVLLTGNFRPGKAIKWVNEKDNYNRLLCLQEETRKYLSGEHTSPEVSEFWQRLETSAEINAFINCLASGAQVLRQRGRKGDIYSIAVLHCLVSHFIHHYLRGTPGIKQTAARKS